VETKALIPMSQPRCRVCTDPRRAEIEASLLRPGATLRAVARDFGVSSDSLQRHRPHMSMILDTARAMREVESLAVLYRRLKSRAEAMRALGERAEAKGDFRSAILAEGEARKYDEMLSKLGEKPGFRDTAPTTVNAPDARIIVTPNLVG
jgi:transposase-like protein